MPPKMRRMQLDECMEMVGSFGPFQLTMCSLLFLVGIFHGSRMLSPVFFVESMPDHRCRIPGINDSYDVTSLAQEVERNRTIPPGDSCHIYNSSHHFDYGPDNRPINASDYTVPCPEKWVYDTSTMARTVTTQLNFVCEDKIQRSNAVMVIFFGSLLGAIVFGHISDRYGRKKCLLSSTLIFLFVGIGMTWSDDVISFDILFFVVGAASTGMFAAALVMGLELVKPSLRSHPVLIMQMFFSIGELVLTGLAYGYRDWRWINLTIACPSLFLVSYYWILPESLRFLMLHKRYQDLDVVLRRIAKWNKKTLPTEIENEGDDFKNMLMSIKVNDEDNDVDNEDLKNYRRDSFLDLFKHRTLFLRTLVILLNWFVANLVFYGLTLLSGHITDQLFLNFFLMSVVEIPANLLTLSLVNRAGRKVMHCFYNALMVLACAAYIAVEFKAPDVEWAKVLLAVIGKFGGAGFLGTTFLWMTELFPTSLRSTGLGVGSACARMGVIIAPYIIAAGKDMPGAVGLALPFIVFCAGAGILFPGNLTLPETNKRDLPQTVEEAKIFGHRARANTVHSEKVHPYGAINTAEDHQPYDDKEYGYGNGNGYGYGADADPYISIS